MLHIYSIITIIFEDNNGHGDNINLKMSHIMLSYIYNQNESYRYIILIKKVDEYYPIFVFETLQQQGLIGPKIIQRIFEGDTNNNIIQVIRNMILIYTEKNIINNEQMNKLYDLDLIKKFIEANKRKSYIIEKKFINMRNLCYAIILKKGIEQIYVPIGYSSNINDQIPTDYNIFDQ